MDGVLPDFGVDVEVVQVLLLLPDPFAPLTSVCGPSHALQSDP